MNAVVPFSFEGNEVRVVDRAGEPWWVLADICQILDVGNPSRAAMRLDEDEKGITTGNTAGGGARQMVIVNESGLYSLILTSRKDGAKRFKKWITSEVIPSIRKTGSYGAPVDPAAALNDPATMRQLLLGYTEKVMALEAEKAELAPKAEALDRIATADGSLCVTDAAKALQVRPKDLFTFLQSHGWIYKRAGGAAYLGFQSKITTGLLEHKVTTVLRSDGTEKVVERALITAKGLTRLAQLMQPLAVVS